MSVRFKVPKSPTRSIFDIDQFLGVDLTNIGTSIDEYRSPNAENMVRWTPGKVRKRTGYKSKIHFVKEYPKDLNRAIGSSDQWFEVDFEDTTAYWFKMYDEEKCAKYIYFDIEYAGKYTITCYSEGAEHTYDKYINAPAGGIANFTYYYSPGASYTGYDDMYRIVVQKESFNDTDYFRVKNMRMCSDTVAAGQDTSYEWQRLPWTPAPEDSGIAYVETDETNNPVYACHIFRGSDKDKDNVINVNRVLDTSSEWETYNLVAEEATELYKIAEKFFSEDSTEYTHGMEVFVEFDYICDADVDLYIRNAEFDSDYSDNIFLHPLHDTNGAVEHESYSIIAGNTFYDHVLKLMSQTNAEVQIRNFSICYAKDRYYQWSPAPEDIDEPLNLDNVYDINEKNYAYQKEFTNERQTGAGFITCYDRIGRAPTTGKFCKISFDLTAYAIKVNESTPTTDLQSISVYLYDDGGGVLVDYSIDFTEHLYDKHFEIYTKANNNNYIKYLNAHFECAYADPDDVYNCTMIAKNIRVQTVYPKSRVEDADIARIYHVNRKFYLRKGNSVDFELLYSDANNRRSSSFQLNDTFIIIDGKEIYTYDLDNGFSVVADNAYIPLITIAKSPNGGGTGYEPLNMLQTGFYEQFTVDHEHDETTLFYLSFKGLDTKEVKAWVLNEYGEWIEKIEGTDFTVNRRKGRIFFATAPGETPITGEDNVRILAYRTIPGYRRRVTECTFGILYGATGISNRLFLSGNPEYRNWDFVSEMNDPTYFPDTGYNVIGSSKSSIMGYAQLNSYLVTFKDDYDNAQAAFIREGYTLQNETTGLSETTFRVRNVLHGDGVLTPFAIGYVQTEPLFLTKNGVFTLTSQDITGEKYSQSRSFYIDGQLEKEEGLENAVAIIYNSQYVLAINNKYYILDGLQATRTDRSEPYATRQYAGFLCTNVPTLSMWLEDDELWIGRRDGKVCRFDTDIDSQESYNDDGAPIYCCWETPDLDGKLFYKNKTFRYLALRMMACLRTSVKIYSRKLGNWSFIKDDTSTGTWFDFEHVDFELFSFNTDRSNRVAHTKIRVKKVDKARFKLENDRLNEPFGLTDLALEYVESGNFKG